MNQLNHSPGTANHAVPISNYLAHPFYIDYAQHEGDGPEELRTETSPNLGDPSWRVSDVGEVEMEAVVGKKLTVYRGKHSMCTAGSGTVPLWFCLWPARVMLARHLIRLSSCSEKATRQLCFHLSRFTCVLVAVEDILLVVDACRRARHLEPAPDFERSSWRFSSAAHVSHPSCILPKFSGVFRTGVTCFNYQLKTANKLSISHTLAVCL